MNIDINNFLQEKDITVNFNDYRFNGVTACLTSAGSETVEGSGERRRGRGWGAGQTRGGGERRGRDGEGRRGRGGAGRWGRGERAGTWRRTWGWRRSGPVAGTCKRYPQNLLQWNIL